MSPSSTKATQLQSIVGLALGSEALWVTLPGKSPHSFSLKQKLFQSEPSPSIQAELTEVLNQALKGFGDHYARFQVALPDPAIRAEVFELEKMPASGAPLREFLEWRFNEGEETLRPWVFSSQALGEDAGKQLLLGTAAEEGWVRLVREALKSAGYLSSVLDMSFSFRFNFFHDRFSTGQGGALVTFEPEFWSVGLWDGQTRLRTLRSKWWGSVQKNVADLPLEETALYIERLVRSYVYAAKDRSVETIYVTAPEDWLPKLEKFFSAQTDGHCQILSLGSKAATPTSFTAAQPR